MPVPSRVSQKLQDYAQRAVRHLQEAERQKQEAENMHVLKLELLVDMWAASLVRRRGAIGGYVRVLCNGSGA